MQLKTSKFFILPIPTDYVLRPQLVKKLGKASACKLSIVAAPAGFGKTTLISSWFHEITNQSTGKRASNGKPSRIHISWLSLDSEDNNPGNFLESLLTSLEDAGISLDNSAPFRPMTDGRSYLSLLSALVHDISSLQGDLLMAIDDYHVIENKEVHGFIQYLISNTPQSFHILVSTRSQPPFETSKLRLSGQLLELGPTDLRFTLEETREYLHVVHGFSLKEKDIASISNKTEGWISGIKMAVFSMQKSEDPSTFIKGLKGSHGFIYEYLMEQVLARQTPEVKEFLLRTSIVESFSPSLCDALTKDCNFPHGTSQKILNYLERVNLFIVPLDDDRKWFRYHHLFAELLQAILQQDSPEKTMELHRSASIWFESNNMISEAVSQGLVVGDIERSARMITANVLLLVEQTELKNVLISLETLFSNGIPVEHSWLNIAYAWVLAFLGEINRVLLIVQKIEAQYSSLSGPQEKNELRGNLLAIQAYVYWVGGRHGWAVEHARMAAEHLFNSNSAVEAFNLTTLASVLLKLDQYEEALQIAQQAVDLGNAIDQPNVVMLAISSLAYVYHDIGQIRKSSEICEQALDQADSYRRKYGRILPAATTINAIQAHNFYWQYELERALWYAKRSFAFSEIWGHVDSIFIAIWILARVLSAQNDTQAAIKLIDLLRTNKVVTEWDRYLAKILEGLIYFENGNLEKARKINNELTEFDGKIDLDMANFYMHCDLSIKVLISDKDYEKAFQKTDQLLAHFKDNKGGYKTNTLILRAWACHESGNDPEARCSLETALEYAETENHIMPFVETFKHLEGLLRMIAAEGKYQGILERIFSIQQAQVSNRGKPINKEFRIEMENPIEPLTERELEILRSLNSHLPVPEIADMLAVSVNTVRTHIKSIYSKLGVNSRSAAVDLSKRLKLLA